MNRLFAALVCLALASGCAPDKNVNSRAHRPSNVTGPRQSVGTGSISGVVTDASNGNSPVAGVLVSVIGVEPFGNPGDFAVTGFVQHAVTGPDGSYSVTGLDDGNYTVLCRPSFTSPDDSRHIVDRDTPVNVRFTTLVAQVHTGQDATRSALDAAGGTSPLVISGGGALSNVNFPLRRDAREASGEASFEFGHTPAVGMHILASTLFGDGLPLSIAVVATSVDAQGHFRIAGVPNDVQLREEDIEPTDPALPGLIQHSVNSGGFTGADMHGGIKILMFPYSEQGIFGGQSPVTLGALASDPQDAGLPAADVIQVKVSQLTDDVDFHRTGCVGTRVHVPTHFRVDVTTAGALSQQVIYRLRVLLTDNLSLASYPQRQIQTMLLEDGGSNYLGGDQEGSTPIPIGTPVSLVTDELAGASGALEATASPQREFGFHTTGPALATDPDPAGDLLNPGASTISWVFKLNDLGTLAGGGTGFYIYVETVGIKGGNGLQDVAPSGANPKKAVPIFVPNELQYAVAVCGRSGVI